ALPVTRSVEILSKPRPAYTEEARRQRIEGEVLLEILFAASGQVRVLRIVRGLSDGLDENAVAAAEAIRFRPAERAGIAADSTAIVHVVCQLAFYLHHEQLPHPSRRVRRFTAHRGRVRRRLSRE